RQTESTREAAHGYEDGGVARVFRAFNRYREDVVLLQQLDGPLGAAGSRGDEQRRIAVVPEAFDLGHPFGNPTAHLDGGLASNAMRGKLGAGGWGLGAGGWGLGNRGVV